MLTLLGRPQTVCSGLSRRKLLQVGGAGLLGASLPQVLAAEQSVRGSSTKPRARSIIFIYLFGGPSQYETFDMKPDAPSRLRGPFQPIDSLTPGLLMCEHMPRMSQISDKFCVIRTVNHKHNDHNASHLIQTGHPWPRVALNGQDVNASDKDWPSMGSVVEYLDQQAAAAAGKPREFPSYTYLPYRLGRLQGYDRTGQYAGWLGRAYNGLATDIRNRHKTDNPFYRDCNDAELDFRIQGLITDPELTLDRMSRRASLLEQFDASRRGADAAERLRAYDGIRQQALALVSSDKIRTALDIRQESAAVRDRYGRHLFGQSALMARRMIEAGARFVTIGWDSVDGLGWDSHFTSADLEKHLMPKLDQAYPALLQDLADRGLLDETLVVCLGEMGRSPQATDRWGRGHWSYTFPALFAGAGVSGGTLIGKTDKDAAYPLERPVSPQDLSATIFESLGISAEQRIYDPQARPMSIVEDGQPIPELFA